MKVKTCVKTAGSLAATTTSVFVGVQGAKGFANAETTKGKLIAGLELAAGVAGTAYAGFQTLQNVKEVTAGIKQSKNSPEAVAQNIQ